MVAARVQATTANNWASDTSRPGDALVVLNVGV